MKQTVVEKLAQQHLAQKIGRDVRAGDFVAIRPTHILTHDNTSAVIRKFQALGARQVFDASQPVFALDHDIQNIEPANLAKYRAIERFAIEQGIDYYKEGCGIGHQLMVERGYVVPGAFVVASDSHANMYGALGAIGTPVVRTDAAAVWATGEFWWQVPRTVKVVLENTLPEGCSGKDLILALCGRYRRDEVLNMALEFSGPGLASLSMDARFTIANMTTEWGALTAWFPADKVTFAYLLARSADLESEFVGRLSANRMQAFRELAPSPDADAQYAAQITLDLRDITPHVAGPDAVQSVRPVADLEKERIPIQKAYLVSCVNSRLEDLQAAARVLRGRKVAPGVEFYVAAASASVQIEAEITGVWKTLVDAGATVLPPSCGPCIGLGSGLLRDGEAGISATNRNFKGRMGSRDARCYLASPAVVAASAAAGYICGPQPGEAHPINLRYEAFPLPAPPAETVAIAPGFPRTVSGRLVFLPQDNLNTDGIYGKEFTYRDDFTPARMAEVVMANYDPQFAARVHPGDVLVAGFNFGSGSSREQAVTALKAAGIPLVIAASITQTYARNAFNNGFLCLEVPAFVERLKALEKTAIEAKQKTIIPSDSVEIDFAEGVLTFRGERFRFAPLGQVPQELVAAGGIENLIRARLAAMQPAEVI